ncbi:hypothetical protein Tco_0150117 [Tanacetum coccineum]
MVAFLEKSTGSAGFHQVIDFLNRSHICYALTKKPAVSVSIIKQFWRSAEASTDDNGEVKIIATIDGHSMTITEASLRRHLKLDDQDGITSIPNSEIFEQLALMGYHTASDKLTFQKGAFSPQWRFLIHNILHCLSPKKTAWEQFSSNIATAMLLNLPLLPSRITSSPSHSPEPSPSHSPAPSPSPDHTNAAPIQPSPTQPSPTQPSTTAEHHFPTPHGLPLHVVYSHGSDEGSLKLNELMNLVTKLFDKGQEIRAKSKIGKSRKKAKVVLSEDDADVEDDSSKQGRKLSYVEVQEKASTETEPFIQEDCSAGATKGTASEVPVVSTAEENISTAGRTVTKDKGKAIMTESEPKKKSKNELEQERQRAISEAKSTKKIDWNDPSVIRYHALKMKPKTVSQARKNMIKYLKNQRNYKISDFKGMSYNEIRPIFEKVWDFNQHIEPMEHGSEKMKSPEKIEEAWKEDVAEDVESLSTKYPIVDWKTYTLTENFMYYQIFRGDGSSKNYKVLSEMLEDFDRQDVEELYRLVKERYSASRPEGYDLMLWGDLHTLFEPDEEDEIWKNQHEYNVISWSLYDFCGIHILLMQNGIAIHMLTEKKYPLSQEMITKMLNRKLEVDHESSQAFKLLRFIRSQVQK